MYFEDFKGGPSWCFRFETKRSVDQGMDDCQHQQLSIDYEEKVANFHKFIETKTADDSIRLEGHHKWLKYL